MTSRISLLLCRFFSATALLFSASALSLSPSTLLFLENMEADNIYRVCQICHVAAKSKLNNQLHYGAVCCMSCKAFFRRCHREQTKLHTYTCKTDMKCDLRSIKRHQCKKCRYAKCLKVGMDSNLVLQGEACKKFSFPRRNKKKVSNK